MKALIHKIANEGRNLGSGILQVDSFMNHKIDVDLMAQCGRELANQFRNTNPSIILTAEISGIAPAVFTGLVLGIPVLYARKHQPVTMTGETLISRTSSHTHGNEVDLIILREFLETKDRVLIIDDFLATGLTILSLVQLVKLAGSELVGIGALIEKTFEGGRFLLEQFNVPIHTLASVVAMDEHSISIVEAF